MMNHTVWLLAPRTSYSGLESLLIKRGVEVHRVTSHFTDAALSLYGANGLLLVDADTDEGKAAVNAGAALMPLLAICSPQTDLPPKSLRVDPAEGDEHIVHHLLDVLNGGHEQRRHPRVRVSLKVLINGQTRTAKNISFYGVWLEPEGPWRIGESVRVQVSVADGATIELDGQVVAKRRYGTAIRIRPIEDQDLLLWVHLLLGELSRSPLHSDIDPFGELFR